MGNNSRKSAPSSTWVQSSLQREALAKKIGSKDWTATAGVVSLKVIRKTNNMSTASYSIIALYVMDTSLDTTADSSDSI